MDLYESMKALWKRSRYVYVAGSQIISKTPGFLISAKMTGTVAATSLVILYDGESANEGRIVVLNGAVMGSDSFNPSMPVPFTKGLFAEFGAAAVTLTVQIITRRE